MLQILIQNFISGALPGYFPNTSVGSSGNGLSVGPLSPDMYGDKEDKDSTEEKDMDGTSRPSSVSSSTSSTLNTSYPPITSIPTSVTDTMRLHGLDLQRPFGLVR